MPPLNNRRAVGSIDSAKYIEIMDDFYYHR